MSQEQSEQQKKQENKMSQSETDIHSFTHLNRDSYHRINSDKIHSILEQHSHHSLTLANQNKIFSSDKLQDFVERDDIIANQLIHSNTHNSRISFQNNRRLSQANMNRLSEFHSKLVENMQQKSKARQSLLIGSVLNFNFDDIMDKVEEIENGKIVIRQGDLVKRYTIGPNMMQYFDKDMVQQISDISKPLYQQIHPYLSWFLVFYATINGACIPPWIMSIPAEKYLRISWRFFMQTLMMIPLLLYERRNLPADKKYQYSLKHIFKLEHIKKVYLVAFSNSIWFTMVLFAFEWNFISHALVLSGLTQFCFSIKRLINKEENHNYESGGQAMVVFGVICVLIDSLTYDANEAPPSTNNYRNKFLLARKPWQRLVIGNFTALLVSYLMFKMSRHQGEARQVYPQFLSMALVFAFTSINMTMSSYFFAGSYLIHDSFWGWLGLFSSEQFSGFLFMSITLGMGNFISNVLINKLFEPIIPATVSLFEPIFSTIILQMVGVQIMPRGLACLGYCFIVPGLFVIVLGQHLLGIKIKQDEEQKIQQQLMDEIKRLEDLQDNRVIKSSDDEDDADSEGNDSVRSMNSKKSPNAQIPIILEKK